MTDQPKQSSAYQHHVQTGLLLNANENSRGLPAEVLEDFAGRLPQLALHRYPDDDCQELVQAYADVMGLQPGQILAGSGSDQMLQLVIGTFLKKDDVLLTLDPDFSMYDFYAASYEAQVIKYPLFENGKLSLDLDEFIVSARKLKPSLVLFSSPNNPTGLQLSNEDILKLCWALAPVPVVIDEAYAEFADSTALDLLSQADNLYVTRTLSKAFGLAGARLGFLVSSEQNIEKIRPYRVVYSVNTLSMALGCSVLAHADLFEDMTRQTIQERERMRQTLQQYADIQVPASQANYLLVQAEPALVQALQAAFEQEQIALRFYQDRPYLRITIGTPEENDRVLAVFESVLDK